MGPPKLANQARYMESWSFGAVQDKWIPSPVDVQEGLAERS